MPLIDSEGRLVGRINVLDLAVAILVVAMVTIAATAIMAPYRIAPIRPLGDDEQWVRVDIDLPLGTSWLIPYAREGLTSVDPRTGQVIAAIEGATIYQGDRAFVTMRLRAGRNADGVLVFQRKRLVVGQELHIETSDCVIEGLVASVTPLDDEVTSNS